MRQDDALEVAKLAAMIGGELKKVDQFTTERSNNPANKININNFIAKVKNPNAEIRPASYLVQSNEGFAALPEEFVQAQVPDVAPQFIPAPAPVAPAPVAPQLPEGVVNLPHITKPDQPKFVLKEETKSLLNRSDVDSIRNSLKSIDKTLAGMLKFLQENSKPKVNE